MPPDYRTRHTSTVLKRAFGATVFGLADALAYGVSRDQLRQAVVAGLVQRTRRGCYVVPDPLGEGLPPQVRATLQRLHARAINSAVAGEFAAKWWQIDQMGRPGPPLILVERGSGVRQGMRNGVLIRHATLPEDHVVDAGEGIRYTSALRTGIDCARTLNPMSAFIVMNSAARRSLDPVTGAEPTLRHSSHEITERASDSEVRAEVRRLAALVRSQSRGHGVKVTESLIGLLDPRLETALESLSWWRFREWGIRLPTPQMWIAGASGRRYRVDFWFGHLIGEADGAVKYEVGGSLWNEKSRQTDLELAGHPCVRWGWKQMWGAPGTVKAALMRAAA